MTACTDEGNNTRPVDISMQLMTQAAMMLLRLYCREEDNSLQLCLTSS